MNLDFYMPTRIVSGVGCVEKHFKDYGVLGKRCIIVTGRTGARLSGALDDALEQLAATNVEHMIFDEVEPNPTISTCHRAGQAAKEFKADFVLAIGGGSAIDAAKAVAAYAKHDIEPAGIYGALPNGLLPIVVIGTTAGTGSEVTPYSVLTVPEQKVKRSFGHAEAFPKVAFADPEYTYSMSENTTISTALDALSHSIESFFSPKSTIISHNFAVNAMSSIWKGLSSFLNDGDGLDVREDLLYGSIEAGAAISVTGTGFPHPLGYNLTLEKSIPHGKACAYFLPEYLRLNMEARPELAEIVFNALDISGVDEFRFTLGGLLDVIKLSDEEIGIYTERIKTSKNLKNAPVVINENDIARIYSALFK